MGIRSTDETDEAGSSEPATVRVVGRERRGEKLRLRVSVGDETVMVVVRPYDEDAPCYARVGDRAVEYEGTTTDLRLRAADWVASALRRDAPLYEVMPPRRVVLGAPQDVDRLAEPADEAGFDVVIGGEPDPEARLAVFDAAVREARRLGVRLTGVPVCLGGPPHDDLAEAAPCAGCLDASVCSGPRGVGEAWLRPRRTTDPKDDVIAVLQALGPIAPDVRAAIETLARLFDSPERGAFEVSFKARGDRLIEGPRITAYEPPGGRGRAIFRSVADALAGAKDPAQSGIAAFAALPARFTLAAGVAPRSDGLALKIYATPPWPRHDGDAAALSSLLDRLGSFERASPLLEREVRSVGLTVAADGRTRVRVYETLPPERIAGHPQLASSPSVAWDLHLNAPPVMTARYTHLFDRHLRFPEAAAIAGLEPVLSERLDDALMKRGARTYVTFIGFAGDTTTLYAQVGPRPREVLPPR
jgi:hypothetical protein